MQKAKADLGDAIHYAGDAYEAAQGADALLVLTDWPQFAMLDLARLKTALRYPIVIDGRNLFFAGHDAGAQFCLREYGPRTSFSYARNRQREADAHGTL